MGGEFCFYVRTDTSGLNSLRPLLGKHHEVELEKGCEFAKVTGEHEARAPYLSGISNALGTDVIWLGFASSVDAF